MKDYTAIYNAFYVKEAAAPDYEKVKAFAAGNYFYKLDAKRRDEVRKAYANIEKDRATVADIQIVMEFFTEAKNAREGAANIKVVFIDEAARPSVGIALDGNTVTIYAHDEDEAAAAYPKAEKLYRDFHGAA